MFPSNTLLKSIATMLGKCVLLGKFRVPYMLLAGVGRDKSSMLLMRYVNPPRAIEDCFNPYTFYLPVARMYAVVPCLVLCSVFGHTTPALFTTERLCLEVVFVCHSGYNFLSSAGMSLSLALKAMLVQSNKFPRFACSIKEMARVLFIQ